MHFSLLHGYALFLCVILAGFVGNEHASIKIGVFTMKKQRLNRIYWTWKCVLKSAHIAHGYKIVVDCQQKSRENVNRFPLAFWLLWETVWIQMIMTKRIHACVCSFPLQTFEFVVCSLFAVAWFLLLYERHCICSSVSSVCTNDIQCKYIHIYVFIGVLTAHIYCNFHFTMAQTVDKIGIRTFSLFCWLVLICIVYRNCL